MMTIEYLLSMAEKRLDQLALARRNSEAVGDLDGVMQLNDQIIETQATIDKLKTLT
jgi:hypothetical protein